MRRIIATLALFATVVSLLPAALAVRGQELVCFRDGSCVPAGSTATPPTPDGTRPPTFTVTVTPSLTSARQTATPTPTGTPCVVVFRDGTSAPCGATATPTP